MFFQGIDEIEEEAARVEAAKAAGEAVELEPLPRVELEGAEIIPVNDKRLHGRSQRRNKAQVPPLLGICCCMNALDAQSEVLQSLLEWAWSLSGTSPVCT